ncbi:MULTISPECIES: hypothetical protein [Rhodopseudomonas]|uniref:hypothetical protein n=1 Tax=Rhodopseudomonas TaxID=1073 RepID=UPI00128D05FA|nr:MULTISPECIES: hypothetical protein [Rhodopseudomonas]MDF3813017.1 hypothetical protein [Rhodopseudomonas sp. BAL398]WOK20216.1 hypothetical protein RBJ75_12160 [Rhodopseudomonas sp. BAL398]
MPNYSAVLLDWDDYRDLGPIDVADADDDNAAKALGIMRAMTWLTENGVRRVRLQITRNGVGLGPFEVNPDA